MKDITEQMEEILKDVTAGVNEAIDDGLRKTPKRAAAKLRSVSPRDKGDYARGWTMKRLDKKAAVVYNATFPGLTHLLNNGHDIVTKKGRVGRVNGDKHINAVEEEYIEEFLNEIATSLDKTL